MPLLSDAYGLLRFASGLPKFVAAPLSTEAAQAYIRKRIASRPAAFLDMITRAVFANPTSPYLKLFRAAGCELGDVRQLVEAEGVEGTLQALLRAGVYTTFEEFKGLAPAVRGSQKFAFRADEFDNPLITTHYASNSGGTRARATRVNIDLEHIAQSAPSWAVWFAAHEWLDRPLVYWTPTHSGIVNGQLRCARFGKRVVKWFAIVGMGMTRDRLTAACVHRLARRAAGVPRPELVPLDEAWRVGEYLTGLARNGPPPCINTYASAAVRICLAMRTRGISLRGVTFLLRGEPLTSTRREAIEASGAQAVQTYGFAEGGPVGAQCPTPAAPDDVHVFLDAFAVTHRARPVGDGEPVGALLLTALRPAAPKIMLNTEIGDHGVLTARRCGCLFDAVGYGTHLHDIRSFEKLTGEGMTFVGADLVLVLEEVLPRRFGGTVADYQLLEEQDARGLPRYALLVSPAVGTVDEKALVSTFLGELGKLRSHYRFMTALWARADILRVERRQPVATGRGKILPFRPLGPDDRARANGA